MLKVLKYSFYDLIRSRWTYGYFLFFLVLSLGLLYLSSDLSKAVVSLMNIVVILCPLVGTLFGALYYYSSREFIELLLALPLRRRSIFLGKFLGLSLALSGSVLLGLLVPFLIFGLWTSGEIWNFSILLLTGVMLTFIFTGLAFLVCIGSDSPIRGFGLSLFIWLFLAVIYDGMFLLTLVLFESYPLDRFALIATLFNPIDLSRVLVMLQLDISAMMGYTGAVFRKFLGTGMGMSVALISLVLWGVVPVILFIRRSVGRDF